MKDRKKRKRRRGRRGGDDDDGEDGEDASGEEEGGEEGGSKDSARVPKKGEVERVGRIKRPPPTVCVFASTRRKSSVAVVDGARSRWFRVLGSGARALELSDTHAGDHGKDPKGVSRVYLHCTI